MGEAWFMGEERRMFDALMAPNVSTWPVSVVEKALSESSSGPVCFGHMREWSEWFPYLIHTCLVHVGPWSPSSIYGGLVTNMMVHCPNRASSRYGAAFIDDVLATLGQLPMDARFWHGGHLIAWSAFQPLQRWPVGARLADDSDLYAAFWLVAKYLRPDRIEDWLSSVVAIDDPAWGAGFVYWLAHAGHAFDDPVAWPASDETRQATWNGSHMLRGEQIMEEDGSKFDCGPFLESWRVAALCAAVARVLDRRRLAEWRQRLLLLGRDGSLDTVLDTYDIHCAAVLKKHRLS
ncbi:hypothetical protein [Lysobacter brunescens]|uniref:Uncharacterized protein n=1 Tax=Lysobacter brunescens TaxID=262323 RepID=A0ABW2YCF9_9GAMM